MIDEHTLSPLEIKVDQGQTIVWKNNRHNTPALIKGVREINHLDSGMIQPGESFSWEFLDVGKYSYVDVVISNSSPYLLFQT